MKDLQLRFTELEKVESSRQQKSPRKDKKKTSHVDAYGTIAPNIKRGLSHRVIKNLMMEI